MCSLLVPRVAKGAVAEVSSGPVRSLGCALQHLLSLPRVTEELQFPGEKLHLHRHRLILLTVNAKGAPCALRRRAYAERLTVTTGAYNALVSEDLVSCSFTEVISEPMTGIVLALKTPNSTIHENGILFFPLASISYQNILGFEKQDYTFKH